MRQRRNIVTKGYVIDLVTTMGNQSQYHWKLGTGVEHKAQVSHLRCEGARVFIHQLPSVTG